MEHETVLTLHAGPDSYLKSGGITLVTAGILALLFNPAALAITIPAAAICAATGCLVYHWDHEASGTVLRVFPDGRVAWDVKSGCRGRGLLSTGNWLSCRYAVVSVEQEKHVRRFVISRSLQIEDDYRVLRTWLRLGLPKAAPQTATSA